MSQNIREDDDEDKSLLYDHDTQPEPEGLTYEEAVLKTGYGRFHHCLLALCGWALSSDAIEVLCISFILPPATCDLELSTSDKGWLNSSIFLGMMVGGYLWGTLADLHGRRAVLLWSLTINALGGLASSFAQSYWLFLLLRVISGIGVGGSLPVIFAYYTEFQSKQRRGSMISFLATFWMCGNILAAGLAWLVIPRDVRAVYPGFIYSSWRLYLAVCILPSLTSAAMFVLMPESPKYLLENGQGAKAAQVLQRMYTTNHKGQAPPEELQVHNLQVHHSNTTDNSQYVLQATNSTAAKLKFKIKLFTSNGLVLFKAPLRRTMLVMISIFFTLSFGYYGLFMWFPLLFQKIELYGGSPCSPIPENFTLPGNESDPCEVDPSVYLDGFIIAAASLPGNILTIIIIDRVGRKPLLASSMVISGLCVFFLWFLKTKTDSLIMSCIFNGVSVIGWNVIDVLCAELFPTNIRTTATGILTGVGRIASILGNELFGSLVSTNCVVPMLLVAVLLSSGGLSSLFLPNTTHRDLL